MDARATVLDLERMVLGAALSGREYALGVVAQLQARHFNDPLHRKVFIAIHELALHGDPIELPSVSDRLKLPDPEEAKRLFELPDAWLLGYSLEFYIKRLKAEARTRHLRKTFERTASLMDDSELTCGDREEQAAQIVFSALQNQDRDSFKSVGDLEGPISDLLNAAASGRGPATDAVPTGFPTLDDLLGGGLRPGSFNVIGGRTAVGKTTAGVDVANHAIGKGIPTLYISLESPVLDILLSLMQRRSKVSPRHLNRGRVVNSFIEESLRAAGELKSLPIYIDDGARTLAQVIFSIRRAVVLHEVKLVVVDYLQLIDNSRAGDQRYVQVGGISHALKWIASELGIALLALCQLNRASTQRVGGEPRLSDIRESDDISHDADLVLLLHRPSLCGEKSKRDVLLVPKNRIPGGQFKDRIELRYDPETNSYSEA